MHPELNRIEESYLALVADLQAGHIGQTDALAVLSGLTAVDGDGWVWSIDPYSGDFLRAMPGQPASPADPSQFVASRLPVVPVAVPPHGTPPDQVSEFLHPNLRPLPPSPASTRAVQALGGVAGGIAGGVGGAAKPIMGLLKGRGRTFAVIAGGILLAAALFVGRPGGAPESSTPSSIATPTVPPPTIVIPGVDTSSSIPSGSAETSAPTPSTLAPVPSEDEVAVLLAALSTGDAATLSPLLPTVERERLDLLPLLGAPRGGFPLSAGTPKVSGSDATLVVSAGNPERPSRRWLLRLRRSDSGAWTIVSVSRA